MSDIADLKLRFLGSLVEQLGAQMYPSATATIAELISNAWDADARNVWVQIPLDERWDETKIITVTDDGVGMSPLDVREAYLLVGRKRRLASGTDTTLSGRLLHGRKGIGKLAAFGTARILDCTTRQDEEELRFRLDYDAIRAVPAGEDYDVEVSSDQDPLHDPFGRALVHGTRIRLSQLTLKRAVNSTRFRLSMSRRFALQADQMKVFINGEELKRFDYDVEIRFPRDGVPSGVEIASDGWADDTVDGRPVRWWIGFTAKPLTDQTLQGISILARGKMVQRPFLFQRAQGVRGQLGQEYLVGEISADWLDEGADIDKDHILANRDQLQLEKEELDSLMEWGRRRLAWALSERNNLRVRRQQEHLETSTEIARILEPFTPDEQQTLIRIGESLSKVGEISEAEIFDVMSAIAAAQGDAVIRQMWQEIDREAPDVQERIWRIIHRFGLIDARRSRSIIEARLRAINELKQFVTTGAREVPTIHDHIKENRWLIDPRLVMSSDEVPLTELGIMYKPDSSSGKRLDFMFALRPSKHSAFQEVTIVEIKRAIDPASGQPHSVKNAEVNKFQDYVLAAVEYLEKTDAKPLVSGLMIAEKYTQDAERTRRNLESATRAKFMFRTWHQVIYETEQLHKSWLDVEERRAQRTGETIRGSAEE